MNYTITINKAEAKKILKELERRFSMECEGNCDVCEYRTTYSNPYTQDGEEIEICRLSRSIEAYRDRVSGARSKWR